MFDMKSLAKTKKNNMKTTAKKILIGVGTVAGVSILAIGGYVVFHKPSVTVSAIRYHCSA